MVTPDEILKFWLDDVGPKGWYQQSDTLDQEIRDRFAETWQGAMDGKFSLWLTYPSGALAYLILTDQFARNMFRDDAKAFASDRAARAVAKQAINNGWDTRIDEPARQFFYMPLMHSENLCDQDRCVRLMLERLPDGQSNVLHARAHRDVIREFGRFPFRNAALGRASTKAEASYLANGGYGVTVRQLEMKKAA